MSHPWKVAILINLVLLPSTAFASDSGRVSKTLGVNLVGGAPELVGLQISYVGLNKLTFGAGFGTLPVSSFINKLAPLSSISMQMASGGPYNIYPSAQYSLNSLSLFARWFPIGSFFTSLGYSHLLGGGNLTGNLTNESTGGTTYGALTGNATFNQPIVTLALGYEFFHSSGFFLNVGAGLGYLLRLNYSVTIGGTIADLAPLDPTAASSFEEAKANLKTQVDDAITKLEGTTRIIPSVFIGMGWAFDLH